MQNSVADRFNEGKHRLGMIPLDCHKWEADGFAYGCQKYSYGNWRLGLPITEQMDSLLRHLNAFFNEYEDIDPESGVHHLGLAQCNLSMMVNTLINRPDLDDRFKIEKSNNNKNDDYDFLGEFDKFLLNDEFSSQEDREIAIELAFKFIHKDDK